MRLALTVILLPCLLFPAEQVDSDANWKIRREALEHSQVMHHLHMLTDRYGPRLTGSPNYEAAARWAMETLTSWGLQNARLEAWDFGHPGWLNERAAGYIVSPVKDNLVFEVVAWTPSTNGPTTGPAVLVEPPARPTKEELEAWLAANQQKIRGRVVLTGKPVEVRVNFNPPAKRQEDAEVKSRYDAATPAGPQGPPQAQQPQNEPGKLSPREVSQRVDEWLVANGALVRVQDAGMQHGMVRAFQNRTYDTAKAVPTVVLRNEDYGRIARLLADGEKVELEFNILNTVYPQGKTTYNVVAEIPGTDKADEIVMLGGHLDSWHAATGATDNGAGVAMMMEAVRLLQSLGVKPRRTIRIALWSAEEQGLLGSKEYVKEHFGTFENPKPDYPKLAAYLNIDTGTGRLRGATVFGPPSAATVLKETLAPFEDLGVMGASATKSRREGGTDSTSFNAAGLPGVGFAQDPIEYFTHTWHTNLDTYERAVPEDMQKASAVAAAAAWHLANRPDPLPRFTQQEMPPPAKPEGAKPDSPPAPEAAKTPAPTR
jgi:carboxypeptidase Q